MSYIGLLFEVKRSTYTHLLLIVFGQVLVDGELECMIMVLMMVSSDLGTCVCWLSHSYTVK